MRACRYIGLRIFEAHEAPEPAMWEMLEPAQHLALQETPCPDWRPLAQCAALRPEIRHAHRAKHSTQ